MRAAHRCRLPHFSRTSPITETAHNLFTKKNFGSHAPSATIVQDLFGGVGAGSVFPPTHAPGAFFRKLREASTSIVESVGSRCAPGSSAEEPMFTRQHRLHICVLALCGLSATAAAGEFGIRFSYDRSDGCRHRRSSCRSGAYDHAPYVLTPNCASIAYPDRCWPPARYRATDIAVYGTYAGRHCYSGGFHRGRAYRPATRAYCQPLPHRGHHHRRLCAPTRRLPRRARSGRVHYRH